MVSDFGLRVFAGALLTITDRPVQRLGILDYAFALAIQIIFDQFTLIILLLSALLWMGAVL